LVEHPAESVNLDRRAAAIVEQQQRLGELKHFAETLGANALHRDARIH